MIGENYQDYMLGGGSLKDLQKQVDKHKSVSFVEPPTFS